MGFSIQDANGNVTSKTVFWGGMPIDVMAITDVGEAEPGETSVLVFTKAKRPDGTVEMRANLIDMGSVEQRDLVHERATEALEANKKREGSPAYGR